MPRVVVLGAGTGVGKTWLSVALLEALVQEGEHPLGLKPIETGITASSLEASDARALERAAQLTRSPRPHPFYALPRGVSPHLAAREAGIALSLPKVSAWVSEQEALHVASHSAFCWLLLETAGGVFSPIANEVSNFELAQSVGPAAWVLVAADALGVLHDVSATLEAMRARGREPDFVVLCEARAADASTGSNARELATLGIVHPVATLARGDRQGARALLHALQRHARRA